MAKTKTERITAVLFLLRIDIIVKTSNYKSGKITRFYLSRKNRQVLSFMAQNERENIRKRQAEGIAAAKARGVRFSRPIKKSLENFTESVKLWERGKISFEDALARTGLK